MQRCCLATVAVTTLLAGSAVAADMPPAYKSPPPVAVYGWTGCYVGGHIGGGLARKDWEVDPSDTLRPGYSPSVIGALGGPADLGSHIGTGLLGGIQIGCDYQLANMIFGVQADYTWTNLKGHHTNAIDFPNNLDPTLPVSKTFTAHTTIDRFGTITGRLGYSSDRAIFYLKGGAAWIHESFDIAATLVGFFPGSFVIGSLTGEAGRTRWGWTVGAGLEYALGRNVSALVEYNYLDFGTSSVTFNCSAVDIPLNAAACGLSLAGISSTVPVVVQQQVHAIKFGLNYRFWTGLPAY